MPGRHPSPRPLVLGEHGRSAGSKRWRERHLQAGRGRDGARDRKPGFSYHPSLLPALYYSCTRAVKENSSHKRLCFSYFMAGHFPDSPCVCTAMVPGSAHTRAQRGASESTRAGKILGFPFLVSPHDLAEPKFPLQSKVRNTAVLLRTNGAAARGHHESAALILVHTRIQSKANFSTIIRSFSLPSRSPTLAPT